MNSRPKIIKKDVPYCERRLQKEGKLSFELITSSPELNHYIDLYYHVYSKSWQETEDIGPTFHRDLMKLASEKGTLRLGFLFLDNIPISAQLFIVDNETAYILKTVYDQRYRKYSPGKVLTYYMIRHVIDADKVYQIDYLHGDDPYKKNWLPSRRERSGIYVFNKTFRGFLLGLSILR